MNALHRIQIQCRCPVDNMPDLYDVEIRVRRVLPVEDILAAAGKAATTTMFQEELTTWLARELNAAVTTRGFHSGVHTEVSA